MAAENPFGRLEDKKDLPSADAPVARRAVYASAEAAFIEREEGDRATGGVAVGRRVRPWGTAGFRGGCGGCSAASSRREFHDPAGVVLRRRLGPRG
ncbi:hypothetical protein GCM10010151_52460 [Actinoallomurus spadix]|uniref:Uncharacterized protein n=1 Tax=Actinoallomurus spadix TaxID=79912 RepID=A0ABN0X6I1_9ACTN